MRLAIGHRVLSTLFTSNTIGGRLGYRFCRNRGFTSLDGPPVTDANRAEATLKRFWKTVGIEKAENGFSVTLDKRPLKTPAGNKLLLPHDKRTVATLIAAEWENQETLLKPHALPMTSIVARAIDTQGDASARSEMYASLLNYLDSDTICFYHDFPPKLAELQIRHWNPLLHWARKTFEVEITTFNSIHFHPQSDVTKQRFSKVLNQFGHWEMAAMERATHTTKSFIIALALIKRRLTVEEAAQAAQVEVSSQIQTWGEVEDTHDVDFHDVRRQLGSAAALLCGL